MGSNVTLKQIADELGMSAMTVSRALNNKSNVDSRTKERVIKKARSMGYTPNHVAKSLVSRKTNTIGVVIPEIFHAFFSEVVSGIEEAAYSLNYQLFLTNSSESFEREKSSINALLSKRVDGLLISCAESANDTAFYKQIVDNGLPIVFFDRCVPNIGASCVRVNDYESALQITQHLVDLGHRTFAHLGGPQQVQMASNRLDGIRDALGQHDLSLNQNNIFESGFGEKGGYNATRQLLEQENNHLPDAIIAVNDPVAFGAIKAITEAGLTIPDDIAIVGFSDDIRSALMPSPLTTVRQPAFNMGRHSAGKLFRAIDNPDEAVEDITLKNEIIIRESCGAAR
ncbi:MAG: LacI family DNA-binding transcriptional regulator [Balneolaceae bacterium]